MKKKISKKHLHRCAKNFGLTVLMTAVMVIGEPKHSAFAYTELTIPETEEIHITVAEEIEQMKQAESIVYPPEILKAEDIKRAEVVLPAIVGEIPEMEVKTLAKPEERAEKIETEAIIAEEVTKAETIAEQVTEQAIAELAVSRTTTVPNRKCVEQENISDNMVYGDEVITEDGRVLRFMRMTSYTWTGNPMCNGEYPYFGCCATRRCDVGKTAIIYDKDFNMIGSFEIKDTGGYHMLKEGTSIDIYQNTLSECYAWASQHGDQVYVEFVEE